MKKRSFLALLITGLMTARCLAADPPANQAPKELAVGAQVVLAGATYVVQRPPVPMSWEWSTRAVAGQIAWWAENKLAIVDRVHPKGVQVHPCPWRAESIAQGLDLALVWIKEPVPNHYHLAVADIPQQKLKLELPSFDAGSDWWISPSARYLIPLRGYADMFCFYDMQKRKLVLVDTPKPVVQGAKWDWGGAVMETGKTARLVLRSSQERKVWRAMVPLDDPGSTKFEDAGVIDNLEKLGDGTWLANLQRKQGQADRQGILAPDKWDIVQQFERDSDEAHAKLGTLTPDGKQTYYLDRMKGLAIHDVATHAVVGHGPGREGWSFNAPTLGVTFDASGKVALFATPYDSLLTALDTGTQAVVARWKISCAGAVLVPGEKDKPGQMIVLDTFLPYE